VLTHGSKNALLHSFEEFEYFDSALPSYFKLSLDLDMRRGGEKGGEKGGVGGMTEGGEGGGQ